MGLQVVTLGTYNVAANTSTTEAFTTGVAIPAGSDIFVGALSPSATVTISSVADSQSNTYTSLSPQSGQNPNGALFRCLNSTHALGASDTITVTYSAATSLAKAGFGWAVLGTLPALDQNTSAKGSSGTTNTGSITTTFSNDLLLMVTASANGGNAPTSPTGTGSPAWANDFALHVTGGNGYLYGYHATVAAPLTVSGTSTITSANWSAWIAAIPPAPPIPLQVVEATAVSRAANW